MIVDLVRTSAADGLRLDGALHSPSQPNRARVDALVCLHGVASNFYGSTLFERVTPALLELGIEVLWANTRGHDGMFAGVATGGYRRFGAAYETVDECRQDIDAWCELLVARGFTRVGLFGHSLGAIKALYSMAHQPCDAVECIVASSPPRLSHAAFNNGESSSLYFETLRAAERHVADGQAETLMEVRFPFPLLITAGGYVDKYGREEKYNIVKFVNKVRCPTLFTYGEIELERGGVAFAGVPEALASLSEGEQQFDFRTIAGADHLYTGVQESLADEIANWLRK